MTKRTTRPRRVKATMVSDTSWGPNWPSIHRWELPRTAAAYDAMVEQGAAAIRSVIDVGNDGADNSIDPPLSGHAMIAALRAIGITRPKETKP